MNAWRCRDRRSAFRPRPWRVPRALRISGISTTGDESCRRSGSPLIGGTFREPKVPVRVDDRRHNRLIVQINDLRRPWCVLMAGGNQLYIVSFDHDGSIASAGLPMPSMTVTFVGTVCCCADALVFITAASAKITSTPRFRMRAGNLLFVSDPRETRLSLPSRRSKMVRIRGCNLGSTNPLITTAIRLKQS